jgi:hypothetical protein
VASVKRGHIPHVILAVLTILALGAIALALSEAPNAASETVQNATSATFGSPLGSQSVSLDLLSSVSAGQGAGTLNQLLKITYVAPNSMTVYRATAPAANLGKVPIGRIIGTIEGYAAVTGGTAAWVQHGDHYTRTEALVPFYRRVFDKTSLPGSVYESATVRNGYLVSLHFNVVVQHQTSSVNETYRIVSIDGRAV